LLGFFTEERRAKKLVGYFLQVVENQWQDGEEPSETAKNDKNKGVFGQIH